MEQTWPGPSLCSNALCELWALVMHVKIISACQAKHIHNHCCSRVVSCQPALAAGAWLMSGCPFCSPPPLLTSLSPHSAHWAREKAEGQKADVISPSDAAQNERGTAQRAQGKGCRQEKLGALQGAAIRINHCQRDTDLEPNCWSVPCTLVKSRFIPKGLTLFSPPDQITIAVSCGT